MAVTQKNEINLTPKPGLNILKNIPHILIVILALLTGSLYLKVQSLQSTTANTVNGNQTRVGAKVNIKQGHLPIKGNKNAKVSLVIFEDFRCPFCKRFYDDTENQIIKEYVDTGKVKLAFRHYQFLGPASVLAGNAAECANEQNQFWQFYDYMFKNQPNESDTSMFTIEKMSDIAKTLNMNTKQFKNCLENTKYQKNIDNDLAEGQLAGVTGTPSFFVNGIQLTGAQPFTAFKTIIDQELAN
ncbi:MAG: DsbA family protein [Patescibacteria group bacterium]